MAKTELEGDKPQKTSPQIGEPETAGTQVNKPGSVEKTPENRAAGQNEKRLLQLEIELSEVEKELAALQYSKRFMENATWLQTAIDREKKLIRGIQTLKKKIQDLKK